MPYFRRRSPDAYPQAVLTAATLVLGLLLGPLAAGAQGDGWRWPLEGSPDVVRGFDPPPQPWAAGHRGVDLRGRPGAPVRSAGVGVVSYAGVLAGRGVVAVHHPGGLETTYEPLHVTTVVGAHVDAGDLLGRLEPGHGDCGLGWACLHWGLRRGEEYLDPRSLVGAGPVRLLPLGGGPERAVAPGTPEPAEPPRTPPRAVTAGPRPAAEPSHRTGGRTRGGAAALTAVSVLGVAAVLSRSRLSARRRGAAR